MTTLWLAGKVPSRGVWAANTDRDTSSQAGCATCKHRGKYGFSCPLFGGGPSDLRHGDDPVQRGHRDPRGFGRLEVRHPRIDVLGAAERLRSLVEHGEPVATGGEEV